MRERRPPGIKKAGIDYIHEAVDKLSANHKDIMKAYGSKNSLRMTGNNGTSNVDEFTWGIGDRSCSVKISNETVRNKMGSLEDRRAGADVDPYIATSLLFKTISL